MRVCVCVRVYIIMKYDMLRRVIVCTCICVCVLQADFFYIGN